MPLSKERMRERKRQDRAKNRFDTEKPTAKSNPNSQKRPEIDADGNIIPEYD